jgi:methionyl-tRNA formyltransferase
MIWRLLFPLFQSLTPLKYLSSVISLTPGNMSGMSKKLKIAVITQNDVYAIPRNFKLLCDAEEIQITELIVINAAGNLENKRVLFLRGFGFFQATKMAIATFCYQLRSSVAALSRSPSQAHWLNLKGLCSRYDIPIRKEKDVNGAKLLERLRISELDVIVSFSAPTIFKSELLGLPRYGCVNLHCSSLPSYSGVLPSFWVLLNNEEKAGLSVHIMDSKIDNGAVLGQEEVDISCMDNMFDVIQATKVRGGHLMLKVLRYIQENKSLPDPVDTSHNKHSYFSWPKVEDLKRLVEKGKRLI